MEIVTDCKQGDELWHQHRLCSLGASSTAKVLAKGRGRKDLLEAFALEHKTGEKTESYSNQIMQGGLDAQPFIQNEYEFITGNKVENVALIKSDVPGVHCSPDGLIGSPGGLEIKKRIRKVQFSYSLARKNSWSDEWKDTKKQDRLIQGIPSNPEYIQVQTSLWVAKRTFWDYCSAVVIIKEDGSMVFDYKMGDYIIIQRVYRDEAFIQTIKTETIKFLAELKILLKKME